MNIEPTDFNPSVVSINVGDQVIWTWVSDSHNTESDTDLWVSPIENTGLVFTKRWSAEHLARRILSNANAVFQIDNAHVRSIVLSKSHRQRPAIKRRKRFILSVMRSDIHSLSTHILAQKAL